MVRSMTSDQRRRIVNIASVIAVTGYSGLSVVTVLKASRGSVSCARSPRSAARSGSRERHRPRLDLADMTETLERRTASVSHGAAPCAAWRSRRMWLLCWSFLLSEKVIEDHRETTSTADVVDPAQRLKVSCSGLGSFGKPALEPLLISTTTDLEARAKKLVDAAKTAWLFLIRRAIRPRAPKSHPGYLRNR